MLCAPQYLSQAATLLLSMDVEHAEKSGSPPSPSPCRVLIPLCRPTTGLAAVAQLGRCMLCSSNNRFCTRLVPCRVCACAAQNEEPRGISWHTPDARCSSLLIYSVRAGAPRREANNARLMRSRSHTSQHESFGDSRGEGSEK